MYNSMRLLKRYCSAIEFHRYEIEFELNVSLRELRVKGLESATYV